MPPANETKGRPARRPSINTMLVPLAATLPANKHNSTPSAAPRSSEQGERKQSRRAGTKPRPRKTSKNDLGRARLAELGVKPSKWFGGRRPYGYPVEDWVHENTAPGPYAPLLGTRCIIWTGTPTPKGYARMRTGEPGPQVAVHRWAHEEYIGPIPPGLDVDHRCGVTLCQNAGQNEGPSHLEAVTRLVNIRRTPRAMATHCQRDHPFTPANTYRNSKGSRGCRICRRAMERIGDGFKGDPWAPVRRGTETVCVNGHERTEENTRIDGRGQLVCKTCRQQGPPRKTSIASACANGHAWTAANTYITPGSGKLVCKTCNRLAKRRSLNGGVDRTDLPLEPQVTHRGLARRAQRTVAA